MCASWDNVTDWGQACLLKSSQMGPGQGRATLLCSLSRATGTQHLLVLQQMASATLRNARADVACATALVLGAGSYKFPVLTMASGSPCCVRSNILHPFKFSRFSLITSCVAWFLILILNVILFIVTGILTILGLTRACTTPWPAELSRTVAADILHLAAEAVHLT